MIAKIESVYTAEKPLAVHCRIGTSGKKTAGTCHPFPVVKSLREMLKSKTESDGAIMHNGILRRLERKGKYSDTMYLAKGFTDLTIAQLESSRFVQSAIAEYLGSSNKVLFFSPNQQVMFGNWEKQNGLYYSNLYWKPIAKHSRIDWSETMFGDITEECYWLSEDDENEKGTEFEMTAEPSQWDKCHMCNEWLREKESYGIQSVTGKRVPLCDDCAAEVMKDHKLYTQLVEEKI